MSKLQSKIPEIMDSFDFEQVHKVMTFLNWKWGGLSVPTVEQLKSCAMELLDLAAYGYENSSHKSHGYSVATGGFVAEVETFSKADPKLTLTFYVDRRSSFH